MRCRASPSRSQSDHRSETWKLCLSTLNLHAIVFQPARFFSFEWKNHHYASLVYMQTYTCSAARISIYSQDEGNLKRGDTCLQRRVGRPDESRHDGPGTNVYYIHVHNLWLIIRSLYLNSGSGSVLMSCSNEKINGASRVSVICVHEPHPSSRP
jgi:hypothetical protein